MRLFVSGSALLLADTHRGWSERTGHAILERYDTTETNMIASNPYSGTRMPGTVRTVLRGIDVIVTDPQTSAALPHGEVGITEVVGRMCSEVTGECRRKPKRSYAATALHYGRSRQTRR